MYNIPYFGSAAVGAHSVPNKRSITPTFANAGVPFRNIYKVIEITANIATIAHIRNIIFTVFSTIDFFLMNYSF